MALPSGPVGRTSLPGIPDKETLLNQTYLQAYQANFDSVQRWTRWKEDHEQVISVLKAMPENLSHEAVVPFGSKALVKAKVVHTNEILTCLGDCWFVKQTAKQAIELCDRRIKKCDETLKDLDRERTLLLNRQTLPKMEEAFPADDTTEIVEEYDEQKENEWRDQHRQRVREYRRKLAEFRDQKKERTPVQTEEDIFRRLEELELEEELNDELERLHADYNGEDVDDEEYDDDEDGYEEDHDAEDEESEEDGGEEKKDEPEKEKTSTEMSHAEPLRPVVDVSNSTVDIGGNIFEKVSRGSSSVPDETSFGFTDAAGNEWKKVDNSALKASLNLEVDNMNSNMGKKSRRISFADEARKEQPENPDSDDGIGEKLYIRFKHSDQSSSKNSFSPQGNVPTEAPQISSPSDIYDYHRFVLSACKPKSILKKSTSLPTSTEINGSLSTAPASRPFMSSLGLQFHDSDEESNTPPLRDLSHLPPVLCDVKESSSKAKEPTTSVDTTAQERPVSRFRASRQNTKR